MNHSPYVIEGTPLTQLVHRSQPADHLVALLKLPVAAIFGHCRRCFNAQSVLLILLLSRVRPETAPVLELLGAAAVWPEAGCTQQYPRP